MIIINPGSGPVENATYENALTNIEHYITDCGLKHIRFVHLEDRDEEGRYCFMLFKDFWDRGIHHFVEMPGLPLEQVRYMKNEGQNIWDFRRLYIDGSSWIWCFAMLNQEDFEIGGNDDHSTN